jgi:phytoene synthase
VYIPLRDFEKTGVSVEQLKSGALDADGRKLLWRQVIRARDAFAQGQPLAQDLSRKTRRAFKRWWLGGLEVLNEIERRKYDVWSEPITLSAFHRAQVRFQALFGRTSFRSR